MFISTNVTCVQRLAIKPAVYLPNTVKSMIHVRTSDREFILQEISRRREFDQTHFPNILRKHYKEIYEHELTSDDYFCIDLAFHDMYFKYATSDDLFETRMHECLTIPYVRESATGLAIEAFIKRLELACQAPDDERKDKKRKKKPIARDPDFSVLEAFRDDDLQNVINMNNEWLEHHDDPEYDHGAPMYWFPDLDHELENAIQNAKPKLINIAMMYNYPKQQRKAWDILYTWKEYISSSA